MYSADDILKIVIEQVPQSYLDVCTIKARTLKNKNKFCVNIEVLIAPSIYYSNVATQTLCKFDRKCLVFQNPAEVIEALDSIDVMRLKVAIRTHLQTLFTFEQFGCCSRYRECSKLKYCTHENPFYSGACMYRKNLEAGKIFY